MFRRILATLDGSPFAEAALPAAVGVARATGAHLRLLTVHDSGWAGLNGEWGDGARAHARRYLDSVRERIAPASPDVGTTVRDGFAVEEILAEADTYDPDLIVMATHGRGPVSRFWLGSVADQMVRRGHRPILLVRPTDAVLAPLGPLAWRRVVVPLDGSELSERALDRGMELALLFGSPMTLLRVVPDQAALRAEPFPPEARLVAREWVEQERAEASRYLAEVSARLREWRIEPDVRVAVHEQVARAVVDEANGELVVIATHARAGVGRAFLGSVADAVVRAAIGPVLVIPPDPAAVRATPRAAAGALGRQR